MKKIFMLWVACAAMCCVACSDDEEEGATTTPDGKRLVSRIYQTCQESDYVEETIFQYDKEGKIEKIVEKGSSDGDRWTSTFTYSYAAGKITESAEEISIEDGEEDKDIYTIVYPLNDKGYISEWTYKDHLTVKNTYNDAGQLSECYMNEAGSETMHTYTWEDGDLVAVQFKCKAGDTWADAGKETYTSFSKEENKANYAFFQPNHENLIEYFGYAGKCNKHLLTNNGECTYTYTFNGEGYVTGIVEKKLVEDQYTYTYTVEYK